ncbi:t-complex protein 1 subunit [Nesidiocoris tenuis]|uniref:T-complex protein 1 subunit gamma n=1 Tax=Nesidiocoris tenuis TaxID=355587 RepID=A0ABN7AQX6_9HEMI|nr:t-complex protein 1 subunit [Nesidiocoris tenuis]
MMPILVLSQNTKREHGKKVQSENINAAKAIAEVIRTCLGPQAMLKMLMDPMGGIVMTNDGNAILREITVQHPAAKTMIEIARSQDEEVGDGTTSVIMLTGELLAEVERFVGDYHPVSLIKTFRAALDDILEALPKLGKPLDLTNRDQLVEVVQGCLGTKFLGTWSAMACNMALEAVKIVCEDLTGEHKRIDLKNYAKIEKVPGGIIEDSQILEGVMINKDVIHPSMSRRVENPRILLLDCGLEYKKGESQTNVEITKESDFTRLLQIEEEYIKTLCERIISVSPTVVCTEKGVSDLAQHYLSKAGISVLRRLRKTDNNRIARAVGATIVSRMDELKAHHVGTGSGLFEVKKLGDEYFTFITKCKDPRACTILLRGPSKDILNEVERNLHDALNVARNIYISPIVVPGGGAIEMMLKRALYVKNPDLCVSSEPYSAVRAALEVIPRTILQNSGTGNIVRAMAELEKSHANDKRVGINGITGEIEDVDKLAIWEPLAVKQQIYKSAIESAIMLLKIDDIVSGAKNKDKERKMTSTMPTQESQKE